MAQKPISVFDMMDSEDRSPDLTSSAVSSTKKPKPRAALVTNSSVYFLVGADSFLLQHATRALLAKTEHDPTSIKTLEAEETTWSQVHDYLATRSLFDDDAGSVVILKAADSFVSNNRPALENWTNRATDESLLIVQVSTFPVTTNLYKAAIAKNAVVNCNPATRSGGKSFDEGSLQNWIISWGAKHHAVHLTPRQAILFVERIGAVYGLIDNELAKVALFASQDGSVTDDRVNEVVGGWRTKTVWEIFDQIADGEISKALSNLDSLIVAGQSSFSFAAQLSWSFRRFGMAALHVEQQERIRGRSSLNEALKAAGFKYNFDEEERRLKRIGRARAKKMLGWLRDLDGQLKGSHSSEPAARRAVEFFCMKFS